MTFVAWSRAVQDEGTAAKDERIVVAGKFFRCAGETWFSRGVSYGPFPPEGSLRAGDALESDLDRVLDLGANTVRVHGVPEEEFVAACRQRGIRILATLSWTQHVDFLSDPGLLAEARARLVEAVTRYHGDVTILAWLVGNEIPATLVRWMEPRRVKKALEELIDAGRKADQEALFSYASYPSTEYLMPTNADFACYNIYLEEPEALERYLARLHHVAGDRPLLIGEFGMDSKSHGETAQAEALRWAVDVGCRAGVAGTTVFAFSDSWQRGGREVKDWNFGLLRRDGSKKPAAEALATSWREIDAPAAGLDRGGEKRDLPSISIVVCTYRGSEVLADCVRSLAQVNYGDFEVLVVNDGGDVNVEKLVTEFSDVRHLKQEHAGLSAARNFGAREARGDILVYTDDDCRVDRDWLNYLALAFRSGDFAAVGGPNVPPRPESLAEACVTAAPGGPAHVLLSDSVAEHVPGCNLAVRREAFEAIGGFREEFWTAGDDVDFCWRLQAAGYRIGFHSAAWVWHLRRRKIRDYLRQQIGYGRAEALLIPLHPGRFGAISAARWRGWVYDSAFSGSLASSAVIYQGVFGYAGFQGIYGGARSVGYVVSSVPWWLLAVALGLVGIVFPAAEVLALAMLLVSLIAALRFGWSARLPQRFDGIRARLTVSALALVQPLVRGAVRYFGSLRYARLPRGFPPLSRALVLPKWKFWPARIGLSLWSSEGATRDDLLEYFLDQQRQQGVALTVGDGWQDWDVEIFDSPWWSEQLTTVTEYHSEEDRLTRARLESRPTLLTVGVRSLVVLVALMGWRLGLDSGSHGWLYAVLAGAFVAPGLWRLVRVGRLRGALVASAHEVGLRRME